MKTTIQALAMVAVLVLSACESVPKNKPERPSVAPVRESFSTIDKLTDELEAELRKSNR